MSAISKPRYIKSESICIGDVIRVTHKQGDTVKSSTGRVAKREHWNHSIEFTTAEGEHLYTKFYSDHAIPRDATITLIEHAELSTQTTLDGI